MDAGDVGRPGGRGDGEARIAEDSSAARGRIAGEDSVGIVEEEDGARSDPVGNEVA